MTNGTHNWTSGDFASMDASRNTDAIKKLAERVEKLEKELAFVREHLKNVPAFETSVFQALVAEVAKDKDQPREYDTPQPGPNYFGPWPPTTEP